MDSLLTEQKKRMFFEMKTREDVANILDIKDRSLRYFLFKRRPENLYHCFDVPKKKGGVRKISAPDKAFKIIQEKLASILALVYEPKICVYGFVNAKNFVDNANSHTNRKLILNIDLKDFFTQIHFGRIRGMFMKDPYSIGEEAATTIAQIACLNGMLPQGAPSSPILTNMICAPLDNHLMRFAKNIGCTYTRYADDITFSTYKKAFDKSLVYIEQEKVHIGEALLSIIERHSFKINFEKVSLRSRYFRQEVTGLTVNVFPNLRRSYLKLLRAILHHSEKNGIYKTAQEYVSKGYCQNPSIKDIANNAEKAKEVESWFKQVLIGKINFIGQVKGKKNFTYLSFAQKLNILYNEEIFDVSELNILENLIADNTFILEFDQGEEYYQGSGFFLMNTGLFTSYHVTENDVLYNVYKHTSYKQNNLCCIRKSLHEIASDKDIDYALYKISFTISESRMLKSGDSTNLRIGDQVIIAGYPNHQKDSSPYIQTCSITSQKIYLGALFYTVSGRIVHGTSGGVVLNTNHEVIGIVKGGIVTLADDEIQENQGFVPIHLALDHLEKQ